MITNAGNRAPLRNAVFGCAREPGPEAARSASVPFLPFVRRAPSGPAPIRAAKGSLPEGALFRLYAEVGLKSHGTSCCRKGEQGGAHGRCSSTAECLRHAYAHSAPVSIWCGARSWGIRSDSCLPPTAWRAGRTRVRSFLRASSRQASYSRRFLMSCGGQQGVRVYASAGACRCGHGMFRPCVSPRPFRFGRIGGIRPVRVGHGVFLAGDALQPAACAHAAVSHARYGASSARFSRSSCWWRYSEAPSIRESRWAWPSRCQWSRRSCSKRRALRRSVRSSATLGRSGIARAVAHAYRIRHSQPPARRCHGAF